jgi:hypothetical protein
VPGKVPTIAAVELKVPDLDVRRIVHLLDAGAPTPYIVAIVYNVYTVDK